MRRRTAAAATAVMMVLTGPATALAEPAPQHSATPPAWTGRDRVCKLVDLTSLPDYPAGRGGPWADGYNAFGLSIVARSGVTCAQARRLARRSWLTGHAGGLSWRMRRAWRSTQGSGYIGDMLGIDGHRRVEYHAYH